MLENLKINGDEEQDSFKNKCKNVSPINEVANKKIVKLQDINHNYNKNKNSDFAKENLKKNFELVKRQTEILQNKKTGRGNLNVSGSSDYVSFCETFIIIKTMLAGRFKLLHLSTFYQIMKQFVFFMYWCDKILLKYKTIRNSFFVKSFNLKNNKILFRG